MRKISRRKMLQLSAFTVAGTVLAACTPQATPTAAPVVPTNTSAPVPVQPTNTPVPAPVQPTNTAVPAAPQLKAPIAYPDPNKLDVGGTPVKKLPIDQIVTYKSLPAYKQATWLDKFVAAGTLPPFEKRLPKEPQV
jgi:hypothetical protein